MGRVKNQDVCPGRILEKFVPGGPPAQAAKFCYIWVCLLTHSSSPWHESCPFISRASPTSGSLERGQGQVPSHLCPSQLHGQLQLAMEGHLGGSAECWSRSRDWSWTLSSPITWENCPLFRPGAPWVQRLCFPRQIGSSLAAGAASSIRLGVPWGQRMCLPNQPGSSLWAGLCLFPIRSGVL